MLYILVCLTAGTIHAAAEIKDFYHPVNGGSLELNAWVVRPEPSIPIERDVFYFTGYYDTPENHLSTFSKLADRGFRVISFSYPSHGKTRGQKNQLWRYNFRDVFAMYESLESATREDKDRPLDFAGWSLGGELAIRYVQSGRDLMHRQVKRIAAVAPSVAVWPIVGEFNIATQRTLTRNPAFKFAGVLKPSSPLIHPSFTGCLVANCALAFLGTLPSNLSTLVMTAGKDKYVATPGVQYWIKSQRRRGASIHAVHYPDSLHMIEAEVPESQDLIASFLSDPCKVAISRLAP